MTQRSAETAPDAGADAERIDLIRRRVINVVGHELRTPVTTLRGLTERLPIAAADELDQLVPMIVRLTARVDDLMADLLMAAGVSTAEPVGDPTSCDLDAAIRSVWVDAGGDVDDVKGQAGSVEAHLSTLRSILHRVVENAFRHTTGIVRVECSPGTVVVANPCGDLNERDLANAFELFYRGEAAVMRGPGLGVGLPIARSLARTEGGEVEAEIVDGELRTTVRFAE